MRARLADVGSDTTNGDWWWQVWQSGALCALVVTARAEWCDVAVGALEADGFAVRADPSGDLVLEGSVPFDIAIIDLSLPSRSGARLVQLLRARSSVPILAVASSLTSESEVLQAYEAGVDGCLTRPDRHHELVARTRALLRRVPAQSHTAVAPSGVSAGSIQLDPTGAFATVAGQQIDLAPLEALFLHALLTRPGRVVTRRELSRATPDPLGDGAVDALVRRIRSKLETVEGQRRIVTVRGLGFRFVVDAPVAPVASSPPGSARDVALGEAPAITPAALLVHLGGGAELQKVRAQGQRP
ncbi:MAG TPA: response regulator transcription factor [Acidimicrobiales bacterium]|nr:response regulator transcription factor [Acidimicrobiales bacterium]